MDGLDGVDGERGPPGAGSPIAVPYCRVYHNGSQNVANSSLVTLAFDTDLNDPWGMHSTSSNTGRLVVPTGWGGVWLVGYTFEWATNTVGYREAKIVANGTTSISDSLYPPTAVAGYCRMNGSTLIALVPGDYVELIVAQDSGGALAINPVLYSSPQFWAVWQTVA